MGNAVRREIAVAILHAGRGGSASDTHAALAVRLREIERGADEGALSALRAVANLVPLAIALILLSSRLALTAFAALLPFAVALGVVRRRLRASHTRASHLAERLHAGLDELVRHLDLWRAYGAAPRVRTALDAAGEQAGLAAARADAARSALSGANEMLAAGALLVVVALVDHGALPLGDGPLVAFAAVFFLVYRPLRDLGDARIALERGAQALTELHQVSADLGDDTAVHSGVSKPRTAWPPDALVVRDLSVRRGAHETRTISLHVAPGEVVAIVGPTGSGKTSFLRALLGLEREVRGEVRYGEQDLASAGVGPDERPFAWVPQEPAIFAGSLADNVALGLPEQDSDAVARARDALATLGARSLAGREDASLSAGGPELSGGERQWIAIARALSTGLPVLLLDEPTAGLDADSQERVLDALAGLRGKRTVILVTHRSEPLAIADRVIRSGGDSTI